MLTFKTQFPMNSNKDIDQLIEAGRIWLAGSPHYKIAHQMSTAKDIGDDWQLSVGSESVIFAKYENGQRLCALRYENIDDTSVRWVTEISGSKTENDFLVSIQLNVDSELPVDKIDYGKRPHILKTIMREIGGGFDGILQVSDRPIYLKEEQLDLAANVITANAGCSIPVVYVSVDNQDNPYINAEQLADWLSGMAHVIVEPTRNFSFNLMRLVYGENAYGGAVAIYWPDGIGKWLFLPTDDYLDPKRMQTAIAKKVRISLLSQRTKKECTWSYIQELKSRRKIQELKDSGSKEIDDYISAFDKELSAKEERLQLLENEINNLRCSLSDDVKSRTIKSGEFNLQGKEKDLYQGERLHILLDALKAARDAAPDKSRRQKILDDFIEENYQEGEYEYITEKLKELLHSYKSMTPKLKLEFEKLGFKIEDGKHHKLVFRGDDRYSFPLPKSGSDRRGGLNALSDIKKKFF